MYTLNLPEYDFRIIKENDKLKIFDSLRKKFVALTPEEWVRQNFLKWLCKEKQYPMSLISVEKGLKYNKLQKRSDAVVYDRNGNPVMIIEFKAPSVEINNDTINQIASYNFTINASYLVVTNGLQHFCLKKDSQNLSFSFIENIPDYEDLE
ncbi:MAG: type I restriction enzyme HsdR N-terminal domain-containing protein [Bacteroidetes bacterium]|nr:type I restriction enzyme HsdR N-terminal domain-containing protein [Bacteroidota bacterium]